MPVAQRLARRDGGSRLISPQHLRGFPTLPRAGRGAPCCPPRGGGQGWFALLENLESSPEMGLPISRLVIRRGRGMEPRDDEARGDGVEVGTPLHRGRCASRAAPRRPARGRWQALAVLAHGLVPAWRGGPHLGLSPSAPVALQVPKFKALRTGKSAPDMKGISGHHRKQ